METHYPEILWENPCDYKEKPNKSPYSAAFAEDVAGEARRIMRDAATYMDTFANKTHSYDTFELLLTSWETDNWFRGLSFFKEEMLPQNKTFNKLVPEDYVTALMEAGKLDQLIPDMYKGLKMVVASFHAMADSISGKDMGLDSHLKKTLNQIRSMLCHFHKLATSRGLNVDEVLDTSEVPNFRNKWRDVLLIFRDSLTYVEYLGQVFDTMYRKDSIAT